MAASRKGSCLPPASVSQALESRDERKGLRPSTPPVRPMLSQGSHPDHFFYFSYQLLLSDLKKFFFLFPGLAFKHRKGEVGVHGSPATGCGCGASRSLLTGCHKAAYTSFQLLLEFPPPPVESPWAGRGGGSSGYLSG